MKNTSIFALALAFGTLPFSAHSTLVSPLHANGIAVNNIIVNQHTAMLTAFDNFGGGMAGTIAGAHNPHAKQSKPILPPEYTEDKSNLYGKMPLYGEKLEYGEYGDDGTVFESGRNGGDESEIYTSVWIDWRHTDDYAKFDNYHRIDSRGELISLGISLASDYSAESFSHFGGFGGVIVADEDADAVDLSELGEYFGLYYGYHTHGFNIQTAGNFGNLFTDAKSDALGKNDFSSLWFGAAVNMSYSIALDDTSVLQPGVYAGYIWASSKGYETETGHDISAHDFNMFGVSPSLRAITHIAGGWYASMSARYVFNFANGGNVDIAGVALDDLDLGNYSEYGLSIEKNMERLNVSATINRRDGGRTGWNGGVRLWVIF